MSSETKKNISRNYNTSKNNNESTSLETLQEKIELSDSIYEHFIDELTLIKFNLFSTYCKEKEINNIKHDMKLRKYQFFQIMKNVFPGIPEFYPLYEKIFNRFKLLKCKIIYNPLYDNYFINSIYSNEEIDIYEISCALACFIKCFFVQKLKILFELSDTDEDGFINEKELEINKNNYNDYSKILKEVFAGYKKQGDIGNSNFDFKSNLEQEKRRPKYNNSIINRNNINNNNQIKTGYLIMNSRYSSINNLTSTNNNTSIFGNNSSQYYESNTNNINNINNNNINTTNKISLKKSRSPNLKYNVYYNKICGLEVFPAKFKEIEKDYKETNNTNKIRKIKTKDSINNKKYNNNQGYMNMVEIIDEISFLINKQKKLNLEGMELTKEEKEIKEENDKYYEKIHEPNVMISVTSLKPYIFEDIFQKKLQETKGKNV